MRISLLLLVFAMCIPARIQAQSSNLAPDPEIKKLHAYLGHWTYEGKAKEGPGCSGGQFTGEMTCQMILGGFFLQCSYSEKEPDGEVHFLSIEGYNPVNKNFTHDSYSDWGSRSSGMLTVSGNTWTWASTYVVDGKPYQYKGIFTFANNGASGTFTDKVSLDGMKWTTCEDSTKYTKVQPSMGK